VEPKNFFAVGTNMDAERLRRIVPGALRLTVARLPGYTVRWHKRAGSEGKLAAYETRNSGDAAWGVVYQLSPADFELVDAAQRQARYVGNDVRVIDTDGHGHEATVYVAESGVIDDSLKPTRSYRDPIVRAARANGLPDEYVEQLALTPTLD
jgi:hypothetical protein